MKTMVETKDKELLQKLTRGGRTNFLEWFEIIADEFFEERVVEERVFVERIQERFYNDFTKQFLCLLPTLFFKFLFDRGVSDIVEPRSLSIEPPSNTKWAEKQKVWEKFVAERD